MAHLRTQVRNALETALSGLATPVSVLFEFRHRLEAENLPAVLVSLTGTEAQPGEASMGDPAWRVESQQTVMVELHSMQSTGHECMEELDQMELEVEAAMAADTTLGGIIEKIESSGSEVDVNVDQDITAAVRAVTYIATWRADFGAPDTPEN